MPGSEFEPRSPLQFVKSPKAMKKALGLFSCAGRTFSSLSHQTRCAGLWREPCVHLLEAGAFFCFAGKTCYRHLCAKRIFNPRAGRAPRPRKLHTPQGGFSCPCGAIHLLPRSRFWRELAVPQLTVSVCGPPSISVTSETCFTGSSFVLSPPNPLCWALAGAPYALA